MPKVKLFFATNFQQSDWYDYGTNNLLTESISEWDTISDTQLELLKKYLPSMKTPSPDLHPVLVVDPEKPIQYYIESIQELVASIERQKQEQAKKRREAERKRADKKRENAEAKFYKLKQELGL